MTPRKNPLVVGIGGTAVENSSTEQALKLALASAEREGARTRLFGREALLNLPHYLSDASLTDSAKELIESVRAADGIILASPGYHGSISGLVKNAIDYVEETRTDRRAYFDGIPVGLIATAYGWHAAVNTLAALRSVVHALRGWPTPIGVAINSHGGAFKNGNAVDSSIAEQLNLLGEQVCNFTALRSASRQET